MFKKRKHVSSCFSAGTSPPVIFLVTSMDSLGATVFRKCLWQNRNNVGWFCLVSVWTYGLDGEFLISPMRSKVICFSRLMDKVLQTFTYLVNQWNTLKDKCHLLKCSFLGFKDWIRQEIFLQIMKAIISWELVSNKVTFGDIPWPSKLKQTLHMALFRSLEVEHGRRSWLNILPDCRN